MVYLAQQYDSKFIPGNVQLFHFAGLIACGRGSDHSTLEESGSTFQFVGAAGITGTAWSPLPI
jgi:hypothetical protein